MIFRTDSTTKPSARSRRYKLGKLPGLGPATTPLTRGEHIELEKLVLKAYGLYRVDNCGSSATIENVLEWMRDHRPEA